MEHSVQPLLVLAMFNHQKQIIMIQRTQKSCVETVSSIWLTIGLDDMDPKLYLNIFLAEIRVSIHIYLDIFLSQKVLTNKQKNQNLSYVFSKSYTSTFIDIQLKMCIRNTIQNKVSA